MSFCVIDVRSNKLSDEVRKRGGGFTKLCSLSPLLQDFVGKSELARTEVMLIKYVVVLPPQIFMFLTFFE